MKRIALLACGVAAAASFSVPASAEPPCFSQDVKDCLRVVTVACYALLGDACDVSGG